LKKQLNDLAEFCKKNPQLKKNHIAKQLGISSALLSEWLKKDAGKFTVEQAEKIKDLL